MNSTIQSRLTAAITMPTVRQYIYFSTIFGVFSGAAVWHAGFDVLLFDFIIISNLLLLCLVSNLSYLPLWMVAVFGYLFISGSIGILNGTDSATQFLKQFLGITANVLYFYYFFKMQGNRVERAFSTYAQIAYGLCIVGIPLWALSCVASHQFVRLQSLTTEPAHFCTLVLPAYYWYAYLYFTSRKHGIKVLIFTMTVALSGSSLGFLSVALGIALLLSRRRKLLLAIPVVIGGLMILAYSVSPYFRLRADDTVVALSSNDVSNANISTYALISNMIVTYNVMQENPILGNGLGSHVISHARFIGTVPGVEVFEERGMEDYNSTEAASLVLRSLSELGILGFLGILWFLFHFHVGGTSSRAAISNGILVCFFLKLIRDGVYFPPEQFFFIFVYFLNHRQFKLETCAASTRDPIYLAVNSDQTA
jgi:hypothetical protein